jgi:hypothetical protein
MKMCPVGEEVFHADRRKDRQTDRRTHTTKQILAFRNFVNAPRDDIKSIFYTMKSQFYKLSIRAAV